VTLPDYVLINALEGALDTDLNRAGVLAGKALLDALVDLEAGPEIAIVPPRSRVLRGLGLTPGSGLQVLVAPGSLVRHDAAGTGADQSLFAYGRLAASTAINLDAADGANPRYDLIYATVAAASQDSTSRNVLVNPGRTVTTQNFYKTKRGVLTIGKVTGTPGALPTLPATPVGAIVLGFALVTSSATTMTAERILDAAERFTTWPQSRGHEVLFGCDLDPWAGVLGTGRAIVDGNPVNLPEKITFDPGLGSFYGPNLEHHLYLIAPSPQSPVQGTRACEIAPSFVTPNEDGLPSAPVTYFPARSVSGALTMQTSRALYLGSTISTPDGYLNGGKPRVRSRDGSLREELVDPSLGGIWGAPNAWFSPPAFYFHGGFVRLEAAKGLLAGSPFQYAGGDITFASLAAGVSETSSTWYYVYLRHRLARSAVARAAPARNVVPVISTSPPGANGVITTPESGFAASDYIFAGSFFNDAASNVKKFHRVGWRTTFIDTTYVAPYLYRNGDLAAPDAYEEFTAFAPASASAAIVSWNARIQAASGDAWINLLAASGGTGVEQEVWQAILFTAGRSGASDGNSGNLAIMLELPMLDADLKFSLMRTDFAGTNTSPAFLMQASAQGYVEQVF
jgi:hypothetical protein